MSLSPTQPKWISPLQIVSWLHRDPEKCLAKEINPERWAETEHLEGLFPIWLWYFLSDARRYSPNQHHSSCGFPLILHTCGATHSGVAELLLFTNTYKQALNGELGNRLWPSYSGDSCIQITRRGWEIQGGGNLESFQQFCLCAKRWSLTHLVFLKAHWNQNPSPILSSCCEAENLEDCSRSWEMYWIQLLGLESVPQGEKA